MVPWQHRRWSTSGKVIDWFGSQCVQSESKACWMSSHLTMEHDEPSGQSSHNYLESLYLLARCRSDRCICLQLYCCYGALSLWIISHHTLHIYLLKPCYLDCNGISLVTVYLTNPMMLRRLISLKIKLQYMQCKYVTMLILVCSCNINHTIWPENSKFLSPAETGGKIK